WMYTRAGRRFTSGAAICTETAHAAAWTPWWLFGFAGSAMHGSQPETGTREALGPEDAPWIRGQGGALGAAIIHRSLGFVPPEQRPFADPAFDRLLNGPYGIGAA